MTHKNFWTYESNEPVNFKNIPKEIFNGDKEDWESLSPGMRREIIRSHIKNLYRVRTRGTS